MNTTQSKDPTGPTVVDVDSPKDETRSGQPPEEAVADSRVEEHQVELAAPPESDAATELEKELEDVRDLARRKQAEFENFRKRVERERAEMSSYASAGVLTELLPVLDNLERAIEASEAGSDDSFREGVQIICRQFREVLNKQGLEEITALHRPFDPHFHEAVGRVETDDHPDGTVLEIYQKGYRLKERLIRAAMVTVSVGSDEQTAEEPDDESTSESTAPVEVPGQDEA